MALTCTVAVIGASQFDHFVSLVITPPLPTRTSPSRSTPHPSPDRPSSTQAHARACCCHVASPSSFAHIHATAAWQVGVLCGTPLSFILPSLIYLRLCDELGIATHLGRTGARVAIVLASAAMVAGTFAVLSSWNSPQR